MPSNHSLVSLSQLENAVEYMSCGEEDTCHLTTP
jgi:hypothetical protein